MTEEEWARLAADGNKNQSESIGGMFSMLFDNFRVSDIYVIGWEAADQWMMLVAGVLVVIAIAIRSIEEQANLLSGGESGYLKMAVNVFMVMVALGMYFFIVDLILEFFETIYSALHNTPIAEMTQNMDKSISELWAKEYEFEWSDITSTVLALFGLIMFWLTYMILVFIGLCMNLAHAILTISIAFFGCVFLPMSITIGLKQLSAIKTVAILVLIWPITEFLFMYLIGGSFNLMFERSEFSIKDLDHVTMGRMVTYFVVFSIINLILAAATIAAPFFAYGLASGNGNVMGMVKSFAAAGIGAGVIAARATLPASLTNKAAAASAVKSGAKGLASAAMGLAGMGAAAAASSPSSMGSKPSGWFGQPSSGGSSSGPKPAANPMASNTSLANSAGVGSPAPAKPTPKPSAYTGGSSESVTGGGGPSQNYSSGSSTSGVGTGSTPVKPTPKPSAYTGGSESITPGSGPSPTPKGGESTSMETANKSNTPLPKTEGERKRARRESKKKYWIDQNLKSSKNQTGKHK